METLTLVLAGLALAVGIFAWRKAGAASQEAQAARVDARRSLAQGTGTPEQELAILRSQVARLAAGQPLSREMVEEGQLFQDLSGAEALARVRAGARVLDVRTPREVAAGIIAGSILIPVDELEERVAEVPRGVPLLVVCAGGIRSAAACEFLASQPGFPELLNLQSGVPSWPSALTPP